MKKDIRLASASGILHLAKSEQNNSKTQSLIDQHNIPPGYRSSSSVLTMVIAPILRTINKGISTGIGLAGEKYHDRKERKSALSEQKEENVDVQVRELINPAEPGAETANDERIWALDEAAGLPDYETSQAHHRPGAERTVSDLVHDVTAISDAGGYQREASTLRLPYPAIIPQRRPGTKARGWARAYPPDLEALGVDQDTFLGFLQSFEDAQQASPWLRALYVSANVVGLVPGHITMAVSISVAVAAGYVTVLETQAYKTNVLQNRHRATKSIQSQCFPRPNEQRLLHAPRSLRHGPSLQGHTKQDRRSRIRHGVSEHGDCQADFQMGSAPRRRRLRAICKAQAATAHPLSIRPHKCRRHAA